MKLSEEGVSFFFLGIGFVFFQENLEINHYKQI